MHACPFSLVLNQVLFVLLSYTLLQAHLRLRQREELNRRTRMGVFGLFAPHLTSGGRLLSAEILFVFAGGVRRDLAHSGGFRTPPAE
jgi:hypothetical protein